MAIHTQQSISGFIATEPQMTATEDGSARFYARFGQDHYRREEDGSFTKLEPSFHNLVIYRATAEHALQRFAVGDAFVAEGYVREYSYERDGQSVEGEEFIAKRIGHDAARTRYEVDRAPRTVEQRATQKAPKQAFESPSQRLSNNAPQLGR